MNNTELFSFDFVNRETELNVISRFLKQNDKQNILWITGDGGAGKSYLLTQKVPSILVKNAKCTYVVLDESDNTPGAYLFNLFQELEKNSRFPVFSFLKKNYKSIAATAGNIFIGIKLSGQDQTSFESFIKSSYLLKENTDTKYSLASFLHDYLSSTMHDEDVLILDNLTSSDTFSLSVIRELLMLWASEKWKAKLFIVTTTEKLNCNPKLKEFLAENLPHEMLYIGPLESSVHFENILLGKFENQSFIKDISDQLFNLCKGYPQLLRGFIRDLYIDKTFNLDGERAQIQEDKFREHLFAKKTGIDLSNLSQPEIFILRIFALANTSITENMLIRFLNFIYPSRHDEPKPFEPQFVRFLIAKLVECDILQTGELLHGSREYRFSHDSVHFFLKHTFMNDWVNAKAVFKSFVEFLDEYESMTEEFGISPTTRKYLLAYHSYHSKHTSLFIDHNLHYARELIEEGKFTEAAVVYKRFEEYSIELEPFDAMNFAKALFQIGHYHTCMKVLNASKIDRDSVAYCLLMGNCQFIQLDIREALNCYNEAIAISTKEKDQIGWIEAMNRKHLALSEMHGGYPKARSIYMKILEFLKDDDVPWELTVKIFMGAENYYTGQESIAFLSRAVELSKSNGDTLSEAKSKNNLGLEYFRIADYKKAYQLFMDSARAIERIQPHEVSYAYNNLGSCALVTGQYREAHKLFDRASIFTTSSYAKFTLAINKTVSRYFLGFDTEALFQKHVQYWEATGSRDYRIARKVYLNYAINLIAKKDMMNAKAVLEECRKFVEGRRSAHRWNDLAKKVELEEMETSILPDGTDSYYRGLPFEPWLLTFSHD